MDKSITRDTGKKELSKEEAVLLLYEAIDKIHREKGCKSEYVLEGAFYRIVNVANEYLHPRMVAQSGRQHADTIARIHKIACQSPHPKEVGLV